MLSRSFILSLAVSGAHACVPCLEAHRHSLAQSFGFDFGISYNYNIVAQGTPFALTAQDHGVVVADQESGRCHFAKQGSISGLAHGEVAFNIGSGMQWSSAGRICSWPRAGGPVVVRPVDETPPENTFTGLGLTGLGLGVSIEIHGYIYYSCDDDLCAYPTGMSPPQHCTPTTLTTTPPSEGVDVPGNYAPLTPLFPPSGQPPIIPTGPPALQINPPTQHTTETPPVETPTGGDTPIPPPRREDDVPPPQHSYPAMPPAPAPPTAPPQTPSSDTPGQGSDFPPETTGGVPSCTSSTGQGGSSSCPTGPSPPVPTGSTPRGPSPPPPPQQQQSPPGWGQPPPVESTPPVSETPPTTFVTPGRNVSYHHRHNETGHYLPLLPKGVGATLRAAPYVSFAAACLSAALLF